MLRIQPLKEKVLFSSLNNPAVIFRPTFFQPNSATNYGVISNSSYPRRR